MSKISHSASYVSSFKRNQTQRASLRLAIGVFISMTLAMSIAWPLAVIAPMFTGIFLSKDEPFFGLKGAIALSLVAFISCFIGSLISHFLMHIPVLVLGIISLLVFRIYYYSSGHGSPFVSLMGLIGIVALPLLGQTSAQISSALGLFMFLGIVIAISLTALMHGLIPDVPRMSKESIPETPLKPSEAIRLQSVFISCAMVLPALWFFFIFNLSGSVLVLLLILIMAQNPALEAGTKASFGLLAANLLGGVIAIIYYNFLDIIPEYSFMVISFMALSFIFAQIIFSGHATAPLFSAALTTVLLLTWLSTTGEGEGSMERTVARMTQIILASFYVISSSSLTHWIFQSYRPKAPKKRTA